MRERLRSLSFALLAVSLLAVPALAEESLGQKIVSGALSSAGGKGGEFAVKFVAGWIYNLSCAPEQQNDQGSKALCSALGSVSGKSEEEWKAKIESKLTEIDGKLSSLEKGQQQLIHMLEAQAATLDKQFNQVPNAVKVTDILTDIDNFWGRLQVQLDPKEKEKYKHSTTKADLEKFAHDVMRSNLHNKLGQLNSLLTRPIDNGQPVLAYPFYRFRDKWSQKAPPEAFPGLQTYDFAETKFMYYRGEMQKGYLVYLWAAEIVEGECELANDKKCDALPITSKAFKVDFDRYAQAEIEAFDAAAHGMILAYSHPETSVPNFLLQSVDTEKVLSRLNYLTSTIVGSGRGAWGEVISTTGDPWDGKITLDCGVTQTLAPAFSYDVPADSLRTGRSVDWWEGDLTRGVYNRVHFSPTWRIHHYKYEEAAPGPCNVRPLLPNSANRLPWTTAAGMVANVTKDEQTFPVGFFYGIQRAGGTYALASGKDWSYSNPETSDSGDATKRETRFDWVTEPNHHEGMWVSLLNSARVDHTVGKSIVNNNQEAHVKNKLYAFDRKKIFFPEGGKVRLHLNQHGDCAKVCTGSARQYDIFEYDVENSPYEEGKFTAVVAAFLAPEQQSFDGSNFDRAKNGIYLEGSYDKSKERKTMHVAEKAEGVVNVRPGTGYYLQYLLYFDLVTHSKRLDSTHYRFLGKITPDLMYFTR